MTTHNLINDNIYPQHHFSIFRNNELKVQSNVELKEGDTIQIGKRKNTIIKIVDVEPTVNELTGYWDTQGKNKKRVWVNPIRSFNKQTKFYTLEIGD